MSYRSLLCVAILGAVLLASGSVRAASPSVTAVLSDADTTVGEMVQLQIRVTGDRHAAAPDEIAIDGLEIHRTGTEQHFEMNNLSVTSSVNYNYTILSERAGTFKIPPQPIQVGGSSLKTPELTLRVTDSGGSRSSRANPRGGTDEAASSKISAFVEIVVPKRKGFVGEVLPAEIRVCVDAHNQARELQPPDLTAQGLTFRKAEQPVESTETIGGVLYNVRTFKAAIAATRSGTVEIPPVEEKLAVVQPRRTRSSSSRSRSAMDPFGLFDDSMFSDPFAAIPQWQPLTLKSKPVTLEIQSLPPNAPPSFSGAVGHFDLAADANPKAVQSGDPITVTATISGRGNFDRVNAPLLEDERGWHKYPPSGKFKQDDDVGMSGTKTFETVFSTTEPKRAVPPMLFTYFDPLKEAYVTAKSNPIPVRVQGGAAPPAATTAPAPAAANAPPPAATPPTTSTTDILPPLPDAGPTVHTFAPMYERRTFWLAQLIPAALLAAFIGWALRRRTRGDRAGQHALAMRREMEKTLRTLRSNGADPHEYFTNAARVLQLKTALACNTRPETIDATAAADTFHASDAERGIIQRVFEQKDELRYGGRAGNGNLPAELRDEILRVIESLRS